MVIRLISFLLPNFGVRLSVWFIGMFLLAVGGALIYLRMKELRERQKTSDSIDTRDT